MDTEKLIKEDPMRWVIMALFCLANISNAIIEISFSGITETVADIYNVPTTWVEMCSEIFMFTYIPMCFPSFYFLDNFGIRKGMVIGSAATVTGAFIRLGGFWNFYLILVGNFFVALGHPFLANSISKVSAFWFKPESRPFATTIFAICIPAGFMIGYIIPVVISSGSGRAEIGLLMLVQFLFSSIVAISVVLFFKDKPKYPPSITASHNRKKFLESIKECIKNKSFIYLFVAFACSEGTLNALVNLINPLSTGKGFSDDQISTFGVIEIAAGLVGSLIICHFFTKSRKYRLSILVLMIMSAVVVSMFLLPSEKNNFVLTSFLFGLVGFLVHPTMPLGFELACEITFPVGEATTTGLLNSGGMLVGIIETSIAQGFGNDSTAIAFILMIGLIIGIVSIILCKEEFKRSNQDIQEESVLMDTK